MHSLGWAKIGNGKLGRYGLTVCDTDTEKCEYNGNAAFETNTSSCRIRIGWSCTDKEVDKPQPCVQKAACKSWEGSFSYRTRKLFQVPQIFIRIQESVIAVVIMSKIRIAVGLLGMLCGGVGKEVEPGFIMRTCRLL